MPINVQYGANPATIGLAAQYAGNAKYRQQQQQDALQRLQVLEGIASKQSSQKQQAAEFAASDAARQQQLQLQARGQDIGAKERQQQLGLQARGQDMDAANRQQSLQLQARGQDLGAQERQQGLMADLYKTGMTQQGAFARDWLQGQQRAGLEQQHGMTQHMLEQQKAKEREDLFQLQFTQRQQDNLNKLANAKAWVDQAETEGNVTAEQATNMRWQLQQQHAGIKPQSIPKPQKANIAEEIKGREMTMPDGSVRIMQPDGRIDYRPPPKEAAAKPEKPDYSPADINKMVREIEQAEMNRNDGKAPDPARVRALLQQRMDQIQGARGGGPAVGPPAPGPGGQPPGGPAAPGGPPAPGGGQPEPFDWWNAAKKPAGEQRVQLPDTSQRFEYLRPEEKTAWLEKYHALDSAQKSQIDAQMQQQPEVKNLSKEAHAQYSRIADDLKDKPAEQQAALAVRDIQNQYKSIDQMPQPVLQKLLESIRLVGKQFDLTPEQQRKLELQIRGQIDYLNNRRSAARQP